MKILITGSDGFVGKQFCEFYKNHDITKIDIKSNIDCREFFRKSNEKFDLIIHLAAIVGGRETIENQPLSVASDLSIDSEMFNWVIKTQQERVVYFSSSAAYPINLQQKEYYLRESDIDLDNIKNPDLTYGWAKLTGEYLAKFAIKAGVKVYIFRPFSGYGETQDLSYPFPSYIQKTISDNNIFEIWGDGRQVRDFIHIDDIVNFVHKVVELDIIKPLNIGSANPINFLQLSSMMMSLYGVKKEIKLLEAKPVGCLFRCSDNKEMLKIYKPQYSLEDMILKSFKYFNKKMKI